MNPSILKEPNMHLPQAVRRFFDPILEQAFVNESAPKIIKDVTAARLAKGLPVDDVQERVEEWICLHLPHWCERKTLGIPIKKEFGKADVLAFIEAVKGTIKAGGVVPQAEAERRANICLQCPYNQRVAGCEGCNGISSMVFAILGARRVNNIGNLRSCGVCGCNLKAKIWVPKDVLGNLAQIQNNADDFPTWCWNKKDR